MRSVQQRGTAVYLAPADVCEGEYLREVSAGVAYAVWAACGLLCLVAGGLVVVFG